MYKGEGLTGFEIGQVVQGLARNESLKASLKQVDLDFTRLDGREVREVWAKAGFGIEGVSCEE